MTSSTLTGDRRWTSARRGGMTVLGKVAVPKPINLPSQRLENHGLDPNVEIVPKGTLGWGSRPSSAGSNAWGTSALSPSTDGGSSSPRHLVGRPSSSGGTRPSTAGSEKAHDSNVSAWGTNSRPSSASGVLASSHTSSTSLRPCSAEKRPGSSQLSRFAEPPTEGSGVWGATSAPGRTGVASSAKEGFSLSTGDFPTLGSEKDESKTNMDSLDHSTHGQPDSTGDVRTMADSRGITHSDDLLRTSDIRGNSWRKDGPPFVENGPRPSMERWHGEPHIYPNPNMAPHFESWRGPPPVNSPGGVWFRGPPGPPYGGPVPPGGFPMEPFPYYHPQVPPGLAGSQPVPPGTGHHGLHPKNGDMPRMPHVPHMHPGMPMRPGFYPGPVPYDGYYRPPLGFCNPSDRDLPFMGMPPGAPIYGGHAHHNVPDINSHPRSREGRGPEHLDPGHPHDHCGPYKVLKNSNDGWNHMNPNDGWNQSEEERSHRMKTSAVNREKGILSKAPLQENAWGDDYKKDEDIRYGRTANMESSHSSKNKLASVNPCSMKYSEQVSDTDGAPTSSAMDNAPYPQDHSLIQKIEGLNAKARAGGGKQEEPNDRVHISGDKDYQSANEANSDVILERHYPTGVLVPVPRNSDTPAVDRSHEATAAPRRHGRGTQNSSNPRDPHAKGKFQEQEVDAWGKKIDSQPVMDFGWTSTTSDQVDHNDSNISNVDPSDRQRAKMREIAKQRAIQLQKEEEERVREQKAKALAKLEELNRRSANQSLESSGQKETITPLGDGPEKKESLRNKLETSVVASHNTGSSSAKNTAQNNGRTTSEIVDSGVSSGHVDAKTQRNTHQEGVKFLQNQLPIDTNVDEPNASQVREVSRQKRGAYKQRQNDPLEEHGRDKMPFGRADVLKDVKATSLTEDASGDVDSRAGREKAESSDIPELPVQRRKVNKSGKSRHKVEEASSDVTFMPKDLVAEATPETAGQNGSTMHVSSFTDPKDVILSSEILASQYRDDTHGKANNSSKSQHFRKPRNTQDNRSSDKTHNNDGVFWAPVRSYYKFSATDHMNHKGAEPLPSSATGNNFVPNSSKTKRAEMERYVPKPVAKEMTQQGSTLQSSSSDPPATDGSGGREKASQGAENVLKAGANMELKHVEGKNRHQRGQGSWRQRVSAEATGVHSSQDNAAANTRKNMQTFNVSQLDTIVDETPVRGTPSGPDGHLEKEPQTIIDGWGFVVNDPSSTTSTTFAAVKDHAPPGKGKRHPSKGQKGVGSHQNHDYKDSNAGLSDLPSSHFEAIHSDVSSVNESRVGGDHSASHWQRKSKGHVAHNRQGDTGPNSGQNAANDPIKVSEDKGADQGKPGWGHHEVKREKKVAPVKARSHLEPEALASEVEAITIGAIDERNERRPSSGHRKNVHYNGRNKRGHEPRGDWSSMPRENKQHFSSTNRERHKQNSHYEYQPVGPYNGNSRSNEAVVQTENQSGALKYRERGQGHSRHGRESSYGRQSGNE